jgi:hypothetical protein
LLSSWNYSKPLESAWYMIDTTNRGEEAVKEQKEWTWETQETQQEKIGDEKVRFPPSTEPRVSPSARILSRELRVSACARSVSTSVCLGSTPRRRRECILPN